MVEAVFDTDFATVSFRATGEGFEGASHLGHSPTPPEAFRNRVDWLLLSGLTLNCSAGATIDLGLNYEAKPGWSSWEDGGEAFSCSLFEHRDGHQAAIGLRDYDWLCEKLGLVFVKGALHPHPFYATFRSEAPAIYKIEISLALTLNPVDDFEALAPWLVTDRMLTF